MLNNILTTLTGFVITVIGAGGYFGVALLMAIESAAIPLPSEIIMPFAGFLVAQGKFTLFGIALAGAVGSMFGSLILYAVGYYGGRALIEKYGRYILISHRDLERSDRFFARFGNYANFFGRLTPIVRTYISFPAGVSRIDIKSFAFFSFLGSFFWSLLLGFIGLKLGENWAEIRGVLHSIDIFIVAILAILVVWYVRRHLKRVD